MEVTIMPTLPKRMDSMQKNMTETERALRSTAEQEVLPDRGDQVRLIPPALMRGTPAAKKYWDQILSRMEGYAILDDLDSDTLGIYCMQLARYDALCKDLKKARHTLASVENPSAVESALGRVDTLMGKLQRMETNILQYAEKLGLTPTGRVRLAQKRAEAAAMADPDADLYGD